MAWWHEIYARDGYRCVYCAKRLFDCLDDWQQVEIDHLIPANCDDGELLARREDQANKVTACSVCNRYRGHWCPPTTERSLAQWLDQREELIHAIRQRIFALRAEKVREYLAYPGVQPPEHLEGR